MDSSHQFRLLASHILVVSIPNTNKRMHAATHTPTHYPAIEMDKHTHTHGACDSTSTGFLQMHAHILTTTNAIGYTCTCTGLCSYIESGWARWNQTQTCCLFQWSQIAESARCLVVWVHGEFPFKLHEQWASARFFQFIVHRLNCCFFFIRFAISYRNARKFT